MDGLLDGLKGDWRQTSLPDQMNNDFRTSFEDCLSVLRNQKVNVTESENTRTEHLKPKFRSKRRGKIASYLTHEMRNVSNQEILSFLVENYPNLVPEKWKQDPKLAGDEFTKVRRILRDAGILESMSTATSPPPVQKLISDKSSHHRHQSGPSQGFVQRVPSLPPATLPATGGGRHALGISSSQSRCRAHFTSNGIPVYKACEEVVMGNACSWGACGRLKPEEIPADSKRGCHCSAENCGTEVLSLTRRSD